MAKPEWLKGLNRNWSNFAKELSRYSYDYTDFSLEESHDLAYYYADKMQTLYKRYDKGSLSYDDMTEQFYEIYDQLYDDYDIDLHDKDFYPTHIR